MSYRDYRGDLAVQILAGFAANPAIFAPNERYGWTLVNSTDADIAAYAVRLADELMSTNNAMPQGSLPASYPRDKDGWICSVCQGWNVPKDRVCMHSHLPTSLQRLREPGT